MVCTKPNHCRMTSLQILCPNGRRQNVKTTQNTKLLQVLEEVCQKQKFLPSEEYKLIHGRTTLDLTLSVRFSNLSNNAKLELVKAEKSRAESEVVIALQLENGERLQHAFSPSVTLWEILRHWETVPDSKVSGQLTTVDDTITPALHPACIYMTDEVCGETALRNTQLRKLGLVGGRAVVRYVKRPVDEKVIGKSTANVIAEKDKVVESAVKRQSSNQGQSEAQVISVTSDPQAQGNTVIGSQSTTIIEAQSGTRIESTVTKALSDKSSEVTISQNINVYIQNDKKHVEQDRERSSEEPATKMVKTDQASDLSEPMEVEDTDATESVMETECLDKESSQVTEFQAEQNQREAAERIRSLNIPGLEVFTPQDFLDLPPDQQQVAQQLAAALLPRLLGGQVQAPGRNGNRKKCVEKHRALPPPQTGFADFKFPEETKGKQLYKNELSEYRREDFKPCDRNTVIYSLIEKEEADGNSAIVKHEEIPEDFFEITESDIRSLVSAQKKKLDEIENQPLMTSTMRKAKLETLYSKYDRVVIRVQFTDKLVLQGCFRPRETVHAVQKFVKENLKSKDIPFYLYTSPPKCVLKDESQTLIEAHLVPASIVYFGSSEQDDHYLSDAALSNIKSRFEADRLVAECLRSSETTESSETQATYTGKGKQPVSGRSKAKALEQPSTSTSDEKVSSASSGKNVPKWFKIGKK